MLDSDNAKYLNIESDKASMQEDIFRAFLEKNPVIIRLDPGQKVRSKAISITKDSVFIDIAGKSEGMIPLNEFIDEHGTICIREGDEIDATFVSVQDGLRHFTTITRGYPAFKLKAVRDSLKTGMPIEGLVKAKIKGGYEVSLNGVRAFCPTSQIDIRSSQESDYLEHSFYFKVVEYNEEEGNIVVSRRALLEEEIQSRIEGLKKTLSVGMEIAAKVRTIQNFGVFADIGGIDGFIPISEISWDRVERPEDILSIGQDVTTRIILIDWEKNRITLSIKATQPDPWAKAAEKYPVGAKAIGTVVKLAPFGAFVNLEPGIDGLVHISNLSSGRRIKHPKEVVEVGQRIEAYILSVDSQTRKISLSMQPKVEPKNITLPTKGEILKGVVEKIMPFGIFVKIDDYLNALVPNSEIGAQSNADLSRNFPAGASISIAIIEVDETKGRVLASIKDAVKTIEQQELQQYKDSIKKKEKSDGLSSFGELLKAKMEEKYNTTHK